jgi:hypothetical protein
VKKALAGAGMLAVATGMLVSGCSPSTQATSGKPAGSASAAASGNASDASADCMFSVFGEDVEVGIAHPTISCSSWMHDLDGKGIVWYRINRMLTVGSPDVADTDYMGVTCDLTNGTSELYVEDGGEMPYGEGTCTKEEQLGWKPEPTPGPLARANQATGNMPPISGLSKGPFGRSRAVEFKIFASNGPWFHRQVSIAPPSTVSTVPVTNRLSIR